MKLGLTLTAIGIMALFAGIVLAIMNWIMGNLPMIFWCLVPFTILGGSLLKKGMGKIGKSGIYEKTN